MTPVSLLACAVLSALSTQAKVVTDFTECESFFYKGTEPSGMDRDAVKICQKYNGQFHFATLYSPFHRIPLYSAYTFDRSNLENTVPCTVPKNWFIEPQIGGEDRRDEMSPESQFDQEQIKLTQAINSDYRFTGYDRGHLLPNTYLSTGNRRATFTLTNVVPMNPQFNQIHWSQAEQKLRKNLIELLGSHPRGKAYIITGTVPHEEDQTGGNYERVMVPTHIWTAVCFVDDSDAKNPYYYSFGFIGENSQNGVILMHLFPQNNSELMFPHSNIYQTRSVRVFVDDCMSGDQNMEELGSTWLSELWADTDKIVLETDSQDWDGDLHSYLRELERRKKDKQAKHHITKTIRMGRRKRDVGSELVQCQYVPEKSDSELMTTADGTQSLSEERYCKIENGYKPCCTNPCLYCKTKNGYKPCCTTPCLYQENSNDYWCYSGQTKIPCSPQYSAVTIKNEKCKEDHPCATYGEDYYWCNTVSGSWDYCSPPVWNSRAKTGQPCRANHACAKYGKSYNWCYTDADDNRQKCCTHDDCSSAINGKTCKRDWPCGKHGEDYLWCYTTDGSWDYCCTECKRVG